MYVAAASRLVTRLSPSAMRHTLAEFPGCYNPNYPQNAYYCDAFPGMSYDVPVATTIQAPSNPNDTCTNEIPVLFFHPLPPRGVTVTLLQWSNGGGGCGATLTGTVRVAFSAEAPYNTFAPEFTFQARYTLCVPGSGCVTGSNAIGGSACCGTDYLFGTPAPSRTPAIPERACGRCAKTSIGAPIDVATGEGWNEKTDLALSGPFGLSFTRFYGSQTAGSADLGGTNWLHSYSASLDVSGGSNVTYYDERGMPYYFTGMAAGASAYDNLTGSTLALSADGSTYTLTTFSNATSTFNATGQLMALHDRIGNAQTVVRDGSNGNRISRVTDPLGRQLCFYYDSASRIVGVAAWTSLSACPTTIPSSTTTTPVVTLAYNTGTNCSANSLCAVTEPDGNTWTYQYNMTTPYPYNLTEILDPLGDPEEINAFSTNQVVHQETGLCSGTSPCADTGGYLDITYPSGSGPTLTVGIKDGLQRASSVTYNYSNLLLASISGPICKCGGDQTRSYAYDSSQRLTSESDDGVNGSVLHTTTYAYGRDAGGQTYPGPTSTTENITTSGTTRTTSMVYYALTDPRKDLPSTTRLQSVDMPGSILYVSDYYTGSGLLLSRTKSGYVNGAVTSYIWKWTYDSRGRLLTAVLPRTDVNATTTFAYYPDTSSDAAIAGQLQSVTDALNRTTQYSPSSVSGFSSYTPYGDPQSVVDPNGVISEFTYDARDRMLTNTVMPDTEGDPPLVTTANYDAAGRQTQQTLPLGNGMTFGYDTSDRLSQVVRLDASHAAHERLLLTYNPFDQAATVAAQSCPFPSSNCSSWSTTWNLSYGYSSTTSDLTQLTNADGTSKNVTYTAQGSLATLKDENHPIGSDYTYAYDIAGRRLSENRVLAGTSGVVSTYTYDLHDNVSGITDPNGNVTTYHYDDFDRVTKQTSPVSGVTTYVYDADNNLTSTTNANGTTETFTYDALDRVLTESDTKGTATASEAWTYDDPTVGHFGIGRLATMTDPSGSAGYSYDRLGNLQVVNKNVAGNLFTYGYFYDNNNNRLEITYPDDTTLSYTYDFADRPYSVQQTPPQTGGLSRRRGVLALSLAQLRAKGLAAPIHAAKPELGKRTGPTPIVPTLMLPPAQHPSASSGRSLQPLPNSRSVALPSGAVRRVADITRQSSTIVTSATYAPFGPMTAMALGNGTTQTMTYTQRYLPQENKLVAGSTAIADHVYSEDHVGNITAISDQLNSGYARSFGYDDLNRLTTANSGANLWGTATGNGYTYDAMGNMTASRLGAADVTTFAYQPGASGTAGLPLIKSFVNNGTSANIAYDSIGSMLSDGTNSYAFGARELLGSDTPNVSSYMYDGARQRVQSQLPNGTQRVSLVDPEDHLLAESALSTTPNTIAYDYIWFGDRPVAQLDSASTHWVFADDLQTPLAQTEANGSISWQAESEPYGKIFSLRAGDVHQPLRMPGQVSEQFDTGANGLTKLSYNNARWYRPGFGRYTQSDPIGMAGGTNPYAYAGDNPLSFDDPSGLTARSNWDFFWDWALGRGPRVRSYGPNNIETQEMQNGPGGALLRNAFYANQCRDVKDVYYDTIPAYLGTITMPFDTSFQAGGWAEGTGTNNGDGTVTFYIPNTAGAHSFFLHLVPNRRSPTGPMSNIDQKFTWTEKIDPKKCPCL